jgi:transposase-like protein
MNTSENGSTNNGSPRRERHHFTAQQKVAIVKRHLVDGVPVSGLCHQHQPLPTKFYQWQKQFFWDGAAAFERQTKPTGPSLAERRVQQLEAKLAVKNKVIAELMAECVSLKKVAGAS